MRHVLVTGAASGIGRRIATRFAALGDRVTMVDLREELLEPAVSDAAAQGADKGVAENSYQGIAADLRDEIACRQSIEMSWLRAPIDVLVNCAGVYPATPFLQLDAATWDSVQSLNVRAALLTTVALANHAIEAGTSACVVNISSGAAQRARPGAAPYSASKAALEMLTRSAALELGQYGIRVNAVSPGFVTVNSSINPISTEYAKAVSGNVIGRIGTPNDIASAVLWLAGSESEWVTGEILRVDGGASTGAMNLPIHWNSDTTGKVDA